MKMRWSVFLCDAGFGAVQQPDCFGTGDICVRLAAADFHEMRQCQVFEMPAE
jgi:hypothetical protein